MSEGTSVCKNHDWMVLGLVDREGRRRGLRCRPNQRPCLLTGKRIKGRLKGSGGGTPR